MQTRIIVVQYGELVAFTQADFDALPEDMQEQILAETDVYKDTKGIYLDHITKLTQTIKDECENISTGATDVIDTSNNHNNGG